MATIVIMGLVAMCVLAVAALAVVGSTNAFADRLPRTARVVATVARHLNGEGTPPKYVTRLLDI